MRLGSCAHFGCERYYILCAGHSGGGSGNHQPMGVHEVPQNGDQTTPPAAPPPDNDQPDTSTLRYDRSHETKRSKIARLYGKQTRPPPPATNPPQAWWAKGAPADGGRSYAPPLARPIWFELGSERVGADGRAWRAVADANGRPQWAPLTAEGELEPEVWASGSRAARGDRGGGGGEGGGSGRVMQIQAMELGKRDVGTLAKNKINGFNDLAINHFDEARMAGPDKEELYGDDVDRKLWAGAAATGWRVVINCRASGSWRYVTPGLLWYKTRAEAVIAAKENVETGVWPGGSRRRRDAEDVEPVPDGAPGDVEGRLLRRAAAAAAEAPPEAEAEAPPPAVTEEEVDAAVAAAEAAASRAVTAEAVVGGASADADADDDDFQEEAAAVKKAKKRKAGE